MFLKNMKWMKILLEKNVDFVAQLKFDLSESSADLMNDWHDMPNMTLADMNERWMRWVFEEWV